MDNTTPPISSVESSEKTEKLRMWQRFSFARLRGRDEQLPCPLPREKQDFLQPRPGFGRRLSRKVVPGLPRPATFRRQNSERRERLRPVKQSLVERRTVSVDRRRALSARPPSPLPIDNFKLSAPEIREIEDGFSTIPGPEAWPEVVENASEEPVPLPPSPAPPPPPPPPDLSRGEPTPSEGSQEDDIDEEIREELEKTWILNLSMHFRDQSPREKFFLTYAQTPQRWRRVTVSCDYRDAPPDSLELDLQSMQFQRDKSARIYESIRASLSDIQFYDTVTNLKLETRDERLHVHVTEDTNEIIPYPSIHAVQHLKCNRYTESELNFESHMSGFVYKVRVGSEIWIKKEIPGPDSVDEFLYEINALNELKGSKNVIQFQGVVVDENQLVVKGLLIGFAEQGAVVDILYDNKGSLPWPRREKWAKQIVQGLSEIHEAGFVQGDFTLSNIVIDDDDEAKVIDINRRGCPVGWEPPEIADLVESGQRISMYIGVKSDLFQLGMVLWALAEEVDEPERVKRPLSLEDAGDDIPQYYRKLVSICLSEKPRHRRAAKDLVREFPPSSRDPFYSFPQDLRLSSTSVNRFPLSSRHSSASPISLYGSARHDQFSSGDYSYESGRGSRRGSRRGSCPGSTDLPFDGPGSYIVSRRGRQSPTNVKHISDRSRNASVNGDGVDSEPQIVTVSPRNGESRWQEVEMDGTPYLVARNSLHLEDAEHDPAAHPRGLRGSDFEGLRRDFTHVDSGLADMELDGIGGHEGLMFDGEGKEGLGELTPRPDRRCTNIEDAGMEEGEVRS